MNNQNIVEKGKGVTIFILFILIITLGFIYSMINVRGIATTWRDKLLSALRHERLISEVPSSFDRYYNSLYSRVPMSLDAFSFVQRALGKHEARNFEVLKADNGALYLHGEEGEIDEEYFHIVADECKVLYDATYEYGGGYFLYVQAPYKNAGQVVELADYSEDITEEEESYLDDLIREKGIPVLDLRDYVETMEYYNTDHHWTVQSAFYASDIIADEIERVYGIRLDERDYYGDMNNYEPIIYENCFLGSIGIKVGPYFGGRDSFTVYKPRFDTDFAFRHYKNKELDFEYSGVFWDVFIDQEMLEDTKYNNKYDVNMRGAYEESIINNNIAPNDYKALLITHSYGRAMAQYMCFDYSELRYIDPQKGRYEGNIVDYIREYQPDVVVYMFNDTVNVGDGNWSE